MTRRYPGTPLWIKLTISALLLRRLRGGSPTATTARQRAEAERDRLGDRRPRRRVSCPGPVGRLFGWDIVEGSVRFDADGRPADETKIRSATPRTPADGLGGGVGGIRADRLLESDEVRAQCADAGTEHVAPRLQSPPMPRA
jgi:hypothetical protein